DLYRNFLFGGVRDHVGAALKRPIATAPRRDHLEIRREARERQLESHLVVALAGASMRDGVGAVLARDLDQLLRDYRPRDRGAEQVVAFVNRVRAQDWKDEVGREFVAQ